MSSFQSSIHSGIQKEERWSRRRRRVQLHLTWIIHLIDNHHFSIYNCRCLRTTEFGDIRVRIWIRLHIDFDPFQFPIELPSPRFAFTERVKHCQWFDLLCIAVAVKQVLCFSITEWCILCYIRELYRLLMPVKCWNVICNMTITAMTNDTTKTALKYDKWFESCIEWISKLRILTRANTRNLLLAYANIVFRAKIAETNVKTKQPFRTLNASR